MDTPITLYGFSDEDRDLLSRAVEHLGGRVRKTEYAKELSQAVIQGEPILVIADLAEYAGTERDPFRDLGSYRPWVILGVREEDHHHIVPRLKKHKWDTLFAWPPALSELKELLHEGELQVKLRRTGRALEDGKNEYDQKSTEQYRLKDTFSHWGEYRSLGRVIHNLKTILNQGKGIGTVLSAVGILHEISEESSKQKENPIVNQLIKNTKHTERFIETIQYLDDTIRNGKTSKTGKVSDLISVLVECLEMCFPLAAKKRIRITKTIDSVNKVYLLSPSIFLDRQMILRAFSEVITNAITFSPEMSEVFLLLKEKSNSVVISILNIPAPQDGVIGIPPEFEQSVFEPFFRIAHHVHEQLDTLDSGMGLTLAKMIIEAHGGSFKIHNIRNNLPEIRSETLVHAEIILPYLIQ